MNGGNFLVSLKEVVSSEQILLLRSLLKENIDVWEKNLKSITDSFCLDWLKNKICKNSVQFEEATLSEESCEVAFVIAGYVAKQIAKTLECNECSSKIKDCEDASANSTNDSYFTALSRGGLTKPSQNLFQSVCYCFAVLDTANTLFQHCKSLPVRKAAHYTLNYFCKYVIFACEKHIDTVKRKMFSIVINIFFNNNQKLTNDLAENKKLELFKKRQRQK